MDTRQVRFIMVSFFKCFRKLPTNPISFVLFSQRDPFSAATHSRHRPVHRFHQVIFSRLAWYTITYQSRPDYSGLSEHCPDGRQWDRTDMHRPVVSRASLKCSAWE